MGECEAEGKGMTLFNTIKPGAPPRMWDKHCRAQQPIQLEGALPFSGRLAFRFDRSEGLGSIPLWAHRGLRSYPSLEAT
jgi:hypothetical protein